TRSGPSPPAGRFGISTHPPARALRAAHARRTLASRRRVGSGQPLPAAHPRLVATNTWLPPRAITRMSLAARSLYNIRQHFRHGLVGSWRRERLLPRVLDLPPVTGLTDDRCEIHVLNCRWDWMMLVWTLRTFYRTSGRRYRLCIHEDGSLGQHAIGSLRR